MRKNLKSILIRIIAVFCILVSGYSYLNRDAYNVNAPFHQKIIDGFFEFDRMHTRDYDQERFKSNCGPTVACNIISFLEEKEGEKYIKKVDGKVPQNIYDEVCEGVCYDTEHGTKISNIAKYIEKYFNENTDRKCDMNLNRFRKWERLKESIEKDRILLLYYDKHLYIIGGYREDHGKRDLVVFTNWLRKEYEYLEFQDDMYMYEVEMKSRRTL